jgi:thiosulfate/3-mercaptopyruvate sulfurtransferase
MAIKGTISDSCAPEHRRFFSISKTMIAYGIILILLHSLVLSSPTIAGTETGKYCPTCSNWSNLDSWLVKKSALEQEYQQITRLRIQYAETKTQNIDPAPVRTVNKSFPYQNSSIRRGRFAQVLILPQEVSADDVVLDISPHAERYIDGAINLNFEDFYGEGWNLKPASEIAMILGNAGISRNDSVVITGECLPCGGGPSPAVFSYWVMKYLGHDRVRLLDGGLEDWEAAGLNTSKKPSFRQKANYTFKLRPELLAAFDFVANGGAQIVDARSSENFKIASIPNAINIPYENILKNNKIRNETELEKIFSNLSKDKSAVVYTNVGFEAAIVWLALDLMGYDARLYTWRDWLENQPEFNFELKEAKAKPNPVKSGEAVTITATFQEKQPNLMNKSAQNGEIKLTVKGCATCGFGSPQGFANINRKNGTVQIGGPRKTSNASTVAKEVTMRCRAIIYDQNGSEIGTIDLRRLSGNTYVGIWDAKVPPGVYEVDIVGSASGNIKTFPKMLEIEVID